MNTTKTKKDNVLTLSDKLSRLNYTEAKKLLGADSDTLLSAGGALQIDIDEQVILEDDAFTLNLPDAEVIICLDDFSRKRLAIECSACAGACEHIGAAFSIILEEKMALGLSSVRPDKAPLGLLSEENLLKRALADREKRATDERMVVESSDKSKVWTDYMVTNRASGRSYRVALRGFELGQSYCSCPDFRKNTLGTCKHIIKVSRVVKRRFSKTRWNKPYTRRSFAVHISYGVDLKLRLLPPEEISTEAARIAKPLLNKPLINLSELIACMKRLSAAGYDVNVYPDAQELIQARMEREHLEKTTALIRHDPEHHPLRTNLLKTELLPYQVDGIAFCVGTGRSILADDMGLGKTIQGIGVAELLSREAAVSRVLIICPASLKAQWRSEIRRFSERSSQLIIGAAKERANQYADDDVFFTICNYEQVLRDIVSIESNKWDLIILDEAQRIKNWEAKTTRIVKGLRSKFALALTGTPLENRLDDLFSIAEFVDDRRLGPAFRFFNHHRIVDERGKVLGYKGLDELRARISPILLRRTRGSVMKELPKRTTTVVRTTPTVAQKEMHSGHMMTVSAIVRKKYLTEMDLLRLQKALLMCRMSADSTTLVDKQPEGSSSKLERLDDLLSDLGAQEDRKIVLFSEWTTMLGLIEPLLDKHNLKYVRLDGSVPQKNRQALVHEFQKDPACRVFITTNAGSTGLNLQAANTVINVDLPWNPAVLEQRISRAHRMGQKSPVQVFLLVTEETIEENLLHTLSAKHQLSLAALDMNSDVASVKMESGMEELKRRLELLLGAKPDASVDDAQQKETAAQAAVVASKARIAEAGGKLFEAAFAFMGELLPTNAETEQSRMIAERFRQNLAQCVETDEEGRTQLKVTLSDPSILDSLAQVMSRITA